MNLAHIPLRVAMGAFILNSGLGKKDLEGDAAAGLHGMAAGAIPQVKQLSPVTFSRVLSGTEIALGAALLLPIVPSAVVGAGLVALGAGLARLYWATPGTHEPGDPRPTQQGVPLAKDIWLLGAGLTLVLDSVVNHPHHHHHHHHTSSPTVRGCRHHSAIENRSRRAQRV